MKVYKGFNRDLTWEKAVTNIRKGYGSMKTWRNVAVPVFTVPKIRWIA